MKEIILLKEGEIALKEAVPLEYTKSTASTVAQLTSDMTGEDVYVYKYMKYGLYSAFNTLYSYNKQPLVFAGTNAYGNREVVFAFSLHDSNFPMLADFVFLMRNLVKYSFPDVIEKVNYKAGERLQINVPASCTDIRVETPMGNIEYPASAISARELVLDEPGVYTVTLTVGETLRRYHVFAELAEHESAVEDSGKSFNIYGDAKEGGRDGIYDDLLPWMIALAVIVIMDWMVYCYDKYQLR